LSSSFKHLQQTYLLRRYHDLETLNQLLQNLNFEAIAKFAHRLTGNARMYEFVGLEKIALDMKNFSLSKNRLKLEASINKMRVFLEVNCSKV